jgi:hypothetical protein
MDENIKKIIDAFIEASIDALKSMPGKIIDHWQIYIYLLFF